MTTKLVLAFVALAAGVVAVLVVVLLLHSTPGPQ